MRLSPHFTLDEFTVTNTGKNNNPTLEHLNNLKHTALGFEFARVILGRPIILTSGYRSREVNYAVGGVSNSAHSLGYAGDFRGTKDEARKLVDGGLVFDQLILERNDTIIHLSFDPRYRMEIFRQPGGPGSTFYRGLD